MKIIYNVLIIDDHQIIIDTFKSALSVVQNEFDGTVFNILEAKCCQSGYDKIVKNSEFKKIDLVFLDISLPTSTTHKICSGEDLGIEIRKRFPKAKIIVCTSFNDNTRLNNVFQRINPESFLIKGDIDYKHMITAIKKVLFDKVFFSATVINFLRIKVSSSIILNEYDIQILNEISNGSRMKELVEIIPLSKTAIEKRKRKLRQVLNVKSDSDRELIQTAREKGFI